MLAFLQANLASILIGAVLVAVLLAAAIFVFKKNKGGGSCGCGCDTCPHGDKCADFTAASPGNPGDAKR